MLLILAYSRNAMSKKLMAAALMLSILDAAGRGQAGPVEPPAPIYLQRRGLTLSDRPRADTLADLRLDSFADALGCVRVAGRSRPAFPSPGPRILKIGAPSMKGTSFIWPQTFPDSTLGTDGVAWADLARAPSDNVGQCSPCSPPHRTAALSGVSSPRVCLVRLFWLVSRRIANPLILLTLRRTCSPSGQIGRRRGAMFRSERLCEGIAGPVEGLLAGARFVRIRDAAAVGVVAPLLDGDGLGA